jgi:hypothetical protein
LYFESSKKLNFFVDVYVYSAVGGLMPYDFRQYRFLFYEQRDRPSLLKPDLKQERLKDKAMSNMVHLREVLSRPCNSEG